MENLAFHAAAPPGEPGYVLLLERPDEAGWVRVSRWASPDYTAAPARERLPVAKLVAEIRREARAKWRFTLPVERILSWLEDSAPRVEEPR